MGVTGVSPALGQVLAGDHVGLQGQSAARPVGALQPGNVAADVLGRGLRGAGVVGPQLGHEASVGRGLFLVQDFGVFVLVVVVVVFGVVVGWKRGKACIGFLGFKYFQSFSQV